MNKIIDVIIIINWDFYFNVTAPNHLNYLEQSFPDLDMATLHNQTQ